MRPSPRSLTLPLIVQERPPHLRVVAPIAPAAAAAETLDREPAAATVAGSQAIYRRTLSWSFTFFNSVRVLSYLPTLWTLWQSGDSSQYSLWTWGTWFGANLTMSLWLIDRNGGRVDRAAVVNLGNTAMCLAVIALIVAQRL